MKGKFKKFLFWFVSVNALLFLGLIFNAKRTWGKENQKIQLSKNQFLQFVHAVQTRNLKEVETLAAKGLSVKAYYGKYRLTLLHAAAYFGSVSAAHFLLKQGAFIDAEDKKGNTPLMVAVEMRHKRIVRFLLEHGADPNIKSEFGYQITPIFVAARNGSLKIAELLTTHGAEVDAKSKGL